MAAAIANQPLDAEAAAPPDPPRIRHPESCPVAGEAAN